MRLRSLKYSARIVGCGIFPANCLPKVHWNVYFTQLLALVQHQGSRRASTARDARRSASAAPREVHGDPLDGARRGFRA